MENELTEIELIKEMLKMLKSNYETYEVQIDFSKDNKILRGAIKGSWLNTPKKTNEIIHKAEEFLKCYS